MPQSTQLLLVLLLITSVADAMDVVARRTQDYYWLMLMEPPNEPPVIDPEVDVIFKWPIDSTHLDAMVTDHPTNTLVYEWTKLSGPGDVEFKNPVDEDITAKFTRYGHYVLQLSVSDGEFISTVEVTVAFDFLGNYINPQQNELPTNRVYPMGQKMMLTPWLARTKNDLQDIKDHGFTMFGPLWDTREEIIEPIFQNAKQIGGLRAAHKIGDGAGLVKKLCPKLDGGDEEQALWRAVERNIKRAVDNPLYNDLIDVWLQGTEEISTRFHQCDKQKLLDYIQKFKKMVETHDPQKRPLWMSDVTGADASQMAVTHKWLDMVGPQMYIERIGSSNHYKHNAIMNKLADAVVKTATAMDASYPVTRPRAKTGSLGALYEPIPSRDNLDFIRKHTMHDMFLGLNRGLNGFQFYSWNNYTGGGFSDKNTFTWYKTAYKESVKLLTDNGLDYVYLWGDRHFDLILRIVSGPDRIQWVQDDKSYDFPTISMQNIQYGDNRFLILTNSSTDAVQVSVTNIPGRCVKVLDIREGAYLNNSTSIDTLLQPLDVRLYRFDPAGEC